MNDSHDPLAEEAAVRQVVQDWAGAVRRRDLAAVLRHHTADMLMFDVPPPFQSRGIEAYRRTWEQFFSWAHDPARFDIAEMTIVAGADVAFVAAAMRCAGTDAAGKSSELDFRLTIGLRKNGGQWEIVHEHHSVPAAD